MDRLSFLQAYCRIVEMGNLSAAAREYGISASQLSRELKAVETGLGVTLLNRNTRRITLTDAGQEYYEKGKRLTGDFAALEARLRDGRQKPSGQLRINAPLSFGIKVLAPALPRFRELYPDINIALHLEDRVIDMVSGGFDLSIRVRAGLNDSTLRAQKIGTTQQRLCAAPDFFDDKEPLHHPDDLLQHALISFSLREPAGVWEFLQGKNQTEKRAEIPVQSDLAVNNSLFILELLMAGQGIGTLPDFVADPHIEDGSLTSLLPDWQLEDRHVYAVSNSQTGSEARIAVFVDFVKSLLK